MQVLWFVEYIKYLFWSVCLCVCVCPSVCPSVCPYSVCLFVCWSTNGEHTKLSEMSSRTIATPGALPQRALGSEFDRTSLYDWPGSMIDNVHFCTRSRSSFKYLGMVYRQTIGRLITRCVRKNWVISLDETFALFQLPQEIHSLGWLGW